VAENTSSTLPESLVDVNEMADKTQLKKHSDDFLANGEMRKKISNVQLPKATFLSKRGIKCGGIGSKSFFEPKSFFLRSLLKPNHKFHSTKKTSSIFSPRGCCYFVILAALIVVGCVSHQFFVKYKTQRDNLLTKIAEIKAENEELARTTGTMEQDLARITADLVTAKKHQEGLVATNQATTDELTAKIHAKEQQIKDLKTLGSSDKK
jgi:outer membrane murein-binding lipoprotein Lpp